MKKLGMGMLTFLLTALLVSAACPAEACTIVMAARGDVVLAGNNEDYRNPETRMWFIPASKGEYGRVCFGYDDGFPQGGMNDQGLFIDANAVSEDTGMKPDPNKKEIPGADMDYMLAHCATVDEVAALWDTYNIVLNHVKLPVADRTGASAVIEFGQGKLQVVKKKGDYQISTNFIQSNCQPGNYPCYRYNLADRMFREAKVYDVALIRSILSACHIEGQTPTLYSNIYDLKNRIVYLYNFHNFDEVVVIDLDKELKKGVRTIEIPSLFKVKTFAAECFDRSRRPSGADTLFTIVEEKGVDEAVEKYHRIKKQFPESYETEYGEAEINRLGYKLLSAGLIDEAIRIFQLNVQSYPMSWNAYDSLGEALATRGDKEAAIQNYKKSLELNPANENGKEMIEKLR